MSSRPRNFRNQWVRARFAFGKIGFRRMQQALVLSINSPKCTPLGQAASQARQVRQRSICSAKRAFMGMRPLIAPPMRAIRPRGESASDCVIRYVGQCGRQRPHATHRFASKLISARSTLCPEEKGNVSWKVRWLHVLDIDRLLPEPFAPARERCEQ